MLEYFNDILGIEVKWLAGDRKQPGAVMNYDKFNNMKRAGKIRQLRVGGRGRTALVDYESLQPDLKQDIMDKLGHDPYDVEKYHYFRKYLRDDVEARNFYARYITPGGSYLKADKQREYYNNAKMLNAVIEYLDNVKSRRRAMGGRKTAVWENLSRLVNHFRAEQKHTLRKTPKSLQNQVRQYRKDGYGALISRKFGNQNTRKRSSKLDELIMSLYVMEGKPYEDEVWKTYSRFITGDLDVFVQKGERAGELLNPEDFYDNGEPVMISVSTVRNILAQYRDIVDKKRNDWLYYNNIHRPHHHRTPPQYSLSKLSLDDRDLPPLLINGGHVKAYFVWDVGSEAILGVSFSTSKDSSLFVSAMQDSFRNAHAYGLGMPMEVEVEHHLVTNFKDELETMFPFVRWAAKGNAQEKRAEHRNRAFKYQFEKKEFPTGRFYAKLEAHRPNLRKEWDDDGMHTVQNRYTFKEVVAIYLKIISKYNNAENSKKTGKSRIQVLKENQHPDAQALPLPVISRSFGVETKTSLRRNQYVTVKHERYQVPSPEAARKIDTRKELYAYHLPAEDGTFSHVYLYQNGNYITTCRKIERYNEARAEQTDADRAAYAEQAKFVKQYDTAVKQETSRLMNLGTLEVDAHAEVDFESREGVEELEYKVESRKGYEYQEAKTEDIEKRALDY